MNPSVNKQSMQLVIISAIEVCRTPIIQLLKKVSIPSFTIHEAVGYKDDSSENASDNWFGTELNEMPSVVFHIYVPAEKVVAIIEKVDEVNQASEYESKIHVVACPISASNF